MSFKRIGLGVVHVGNDTEVIPYVGLARYCERPRQIDVLNDLRVVQQG
ncbi:MAG: hypothetical protein JRH06_14605 [Deltaproteobacteria bacterium]|nr:hypothetical protein [Deltaproteobacteria bacterium]MBW2138767.1 hypothetical protein [Deltaproteobacteria bacterium]